MACAWKNPSCRIGLILGTGSNACYVERLENVGLWDEDHDDPNQVVINTEWGAFGDNGTLEFIRTEYDRTIDKHSLNPGRQLYYALSLSDSHFLPATHLSGSFSLFQIRENDLGNVHGRSDPSRFSPTDARGTPLWRNGPRNVIRAGPVFHEIRVWNREVTIGQHPVVVTECTNCFFASSHDKRQEGRIHVLSSGAGRVGLRRCVRRRLRQRALHLRSRFPAGGAHRRRWRGLPSQQDGPAARDGGRRWLRLPLPPPLPRSDGRQDRTAHQSRTNGEPMAIFQTKQKKKKQSCPSHRRKVPPFDELEPITRVLRTKTNKEEGEIY